MISISDQALTLSFKNIKVDVPIRITLAKQNMWSDLPFLDNIALGMPPIPLPIVSDMLKRATIMRLDQSTLSMKDN